MNPPVEGFVTQALPIAIAIVVMVAVTAFLARHHRRQLKAMIPVLDPGAQMSGTFSPRLRGSYQGRSVTIWFVSGSRYRPRSLNLSLECPYGVSFGARAKRLGSSVGTWLRWKDRVEAGIPYLDEEYRCSSSDPQQFTEWLRRSAEARAAMEQLLRMRGVTTLTLGRGTLQARIERYQNDQVGPSSVHALLDAQEQLARAAQGA